MKKIDEFSLTAAKLSKAVYNDPDNNQQNAGYGSIDGCKFLVSSKKSQTEYLGVAFKCGDLLAIASRSIDLSGSNDLEGALQSFLEVGLEQQLGEAAAFSKLVINKYKPANTVFIAHSAGGVIAQILGLKFNSYAITFDSPGAYWSAVKHFGRGVFNASKIASFVSAPNAINTNKEHLTEGVKEIKFYSDPGGADYSAYLTYSKVQHRITNFIEKLKAKDFSGYIVHDFWPSGKIAGYFYYLRNNDLWKRQKNLSPSVNEIRDKELKILNSAEGAVFSAFLGDWSGFASNTWQMVKGAASFVGIKGAGDVLKLAQKVGLDDEIGEVIEGATSFASDLGIDEQYLMNGVEFVASKAGVKDAEGFTDSIFKMGDHDGGAHEEDNSEGGGKEEVTPPAEEGNAEEVTPPAEEGNAEEVAPPAEEDAEEVNFASGVGNADEM